MNKLNYRLALAPMAGVTDHAFRTTCGRLYAELVYTEMISAKAVHFEDRKTAELAELFDDDKFIAIQLFGHEPDIMAEAASKMESGEYKHRRGSRRPDIIDINMGCPAPKIANNGEGSALLKTPELAEEIVKKCVAAVKIPVTVKMRIGWDEKSIIGVEFAKRMEQAGAATLTVHGRTREGRFSAPINFDEIARIKAAVQIPVIANGEIFTAADAKRMHERTGCDALMLGRGVLGNPWLFAEINAMYEGGEFVPPTPRERIETALDELSRRIAEKGEHHAICESRKLLAWYLKGLRGAAECRGTLNSALTYAEVEAALMSLIED